MGTPMSRRGRILFDKYVAESLNNPNLGGLGIETHVFISPATLRLITFQLGK
jgi:hypothetical protein